MGCIIWIILFVCMIFVDEPWSENVALVTGIVVVIAWLLDGSMGGRNDEQN